MSIILDEDPASVADGGERPVASRGRLVLRRFRRNRLAVTGVVVVVLLYLAAFSYSWYWPFNYTYSDPAAFLAAPGGAHPFGTTNDGVDMYALVMRGMQKSLIIGLLVAVVSTAVAAIVGAAAGYFRGFGDRALMWLVDLLLTLPTFLVLAVCSPAFRGKSWLLFVLLLAGFNWMVTARIVRGLTLSLKEREFVRAARLMGSSPWRVIRKHILPQMSSLLIADATINVGIAILTETSLSYFGFGVQAPDVSLGTLIAAGTGSALSYPWLFFEPAGFLVLTVLAVNLVGDGLRDAFDPNSSRGVRRRERRAERQARRG